MVFIKSLNDDDNGHFGHWGNMKVVYDGGGDTHSFERYLSL